MALPWAGGLYWALALLCVGNGLFKPNVSSRVGALYDAGDPRKAQGFYLFYMGINIGATLAPIVCSTVAARLGWHYGFGLAGVGMILGLAIVVRGRRLLRPRGAAEAALLDAPLSPRRTLALAGAVVAMVLMAFHTAFWAAFEQVGSSLTVLAEHHVDRTVAGVRIPAPALLALNGAFVIVVAPLMSWGWARLPLRRGVRPRGRWRVRAGARAARAAPRGAADRRGRGRVGRVSRAPMSRAPSWALVPWCIGPASGRAP